MARIRGVICYNEVIEQQTCGKRVHWLLVVKGKSWGQIAAPQLQDLAPPRSPPGELTQVSPYLQTMICLVLAADVPEAIAI